MQGVVAVAGLAAPEVGDGIDQAPRGVGVGLGEALAVPRMY